MPQELHQEVIDILMFEEKETLHKWESKQIVVKQKHESVAQNVTETILTLRWFLVNRLIETLKQNISTDPEKDNMEILSSTMDYTKLINIFSDKLGRVLTRF